MGQQGAKGKPKTPNSGRKKGTPNQATARIREVAQLYGVEALEMLVSIIRSKEATLQEKIVACKEVLDRGYGRPAETKEHAAVIPPPMLVSGDVREQLQSVIDRVSSLYAQRGGAGQLKPN